MIITKWFVYVLIRVAHKTFNILYLFIYFYSKMIILIMFGIASPINNEFRIISECSVLAGTVYKPLELTRLISFNGL